MLQLPYWITSTLAATPAFLWIFFGLGLPWALALLPRRDWSDRPLVACLSFACGPALLTAWMFLLGTFGSALTFAPVFIGTVVLAFLGAFLAWRKRLAAASASLSFSPLPLGEGRGVRAAFDEKLLMLLIAAAFVVRWLGIAYWPFTAYDALWVYGYEARLYSALGHIPTTIGYYPQFLPLQFTYAQLAVGGIDDHAARAGMLFIQIGAALAVYVLGSRLFNRRVGLIAMSLWALYPHVGDWSRFGDLEIPVTFLFTASAAFFLMAWIGQEPRRRYAMIAGLLFGAAMWTKPTAGAFIWGVLLLLALDLWRVRFDWRAWRPRLEIALITGIACVPLGAVWYIRNLLLGHAAIDLPPAFWLTLAARSGLEFGWPLLALLLLFGSVYLGRRGAKPDPKLAFSGLALVLGGLLPSIFDPHRIGLLEWLALIVGVALIALAFWRFARHYVELPARRDAALIGWALALALPYFLTWFYSYSYHYRLSFAIVPLLLLPSAVILARWFTPQRIAAWRVPARAACAVVIVALALPSVVNALYDVNAGWDWLWTDKLPDDSARYTSGNAALMDVVNGLMIWMGEHPGQTLTVTAPGVRRLPFFFPTQDIRIDDAPIRLDDLRGAAYFIDSSPEGSGAYEDVPMIHNQVIGALNRPDVMRLAWGKDDGTFRYQVYELHLADRFEKPYVNVATTGEIVFGGFAQLLGHDIGGSDFWPGRKITLHLIWKALGPASEDYTIFIHLMDKDGQLQAAWDGPLALSKDGRRYYSTLVWQPKEYLSDTRVLRLPETPVPVGEGYTIVVGFYNVVTGQRVPMTINGKPAGDSGYTLGEQIQVLAAEPKK